MTFLIKNVDLLSMDGNKEIIYNTNVYIKEDKIKYIGDIREDIEVKRIIDGKNKLLCQD